MKDKKKNKKASFFIPFILLVLVFGFILRVILSPFGTLGLDQNTFIAWSDILAKGGFANFYKGWSDYLPGYLYVLWFLGKISVLLPGFSTLIYKLPAILADCGTGWLIYMAVRKIKNQRWANILTFFYIFNPGVIANSTLWGQVDSLTSFFSVASIYLLNINPFVSAFFLAVGALVKPQAALAAPIIFLLMVKGKWAFRRIAVFIMLSFLVFIVGFVPFAGGKSLPLFIVERMAATLGQYPYTSINAFNFWAIIGMWRADGGGIQLAGTALAGVIFLILGRGFIFGDKLKKEKAGEYYLLAVAFALNFLFFTRMHERHLLPLLAPLIITVAVRPSLIAAYIGFSATYVFNMYYSYIWITNQFKEVFSKEVVKLLSFSNILFLILASFYKRLDGRIKSIRFKKFRFGGFWEEGKLELPESNLSRHKIYILLGVIVAFSFATRFFSLNNPPSEYFDEVYHAFTARQILHGNPKAWEWWNTPPTGFAYEWTHPPLAKEGMVLGMLILGENSFGWRAPGAILGVGGVVLVYLIATVLFKDRMVGILSSGIFALDGLPLVMSRIGMNDSYFLFFALLAIYFFLREKNLPSAIALGLSLSSKWSALWVIPIIVVFHFVLKRKLKLSYIWFLILPPLVYLISYLPLFTTGHSFEIFVGMQKQMWWYHTNLRATHPYTSSWWSWPLLIRPVWLYTSGDVRGLIANIYTMGNPFIFWMGLASVIWLTIDGFRRRARSVLLVVFSYLVFFVPWALSPRIMFLYHYLPSIPFLAMAMGYTLRKYKSLAGPALTIAFVVFIYFLPHFTGVKIPTILDSSYYWFDSWR